MCRIHLRAARDQSRAARHQHPGKLAIVLVRASPGLALQPHASPIAAHGRTLPQVTLVTCRKRTEGAWCTWTTEFGCQRASKTSLITFFIGVLLVVMRANCWL